METLHSFSSQCARLLIKVIGRGWGQENHIEHILKDSFRGKAFYRTMEFDFIQNVSHFEVRNFGTISYEKCRKF